MTAEAMLAKDFSVEWNGARRPYLDVAASPDAGKDADDPALAEWVVPVSWIAVRDRQDAVRDSDFFANQNTVVKLTHGYTLQKLVESFGPGHQAALR